MLDGLLSADMGIRAVKLEFCNMLAFFSGEACCGFDKKHEGLAVAEERL